MKTKNSFVIFSLVLVAAFILAVPTGFTAPGLPGIGDPDGRQCIVKYHDGQCCMYVGDSTHKCPGAECKDDSDCLPNHECYNRRCVDPECHPLDECEGADPILTPSLKTVKAMRVE